MTSPESDNLIASWLHVETAIPGRTMADAIRDLNEELGMAVTHSRVREWMRGEKMPGPDACRYMAAVAVGWVLRQEGVRLEDGALDRIAARLSPTARAVSA